MNGQGRDALPRVRVASSDTMRTRGSASLPADIFRTRRSASLPADTIRTRGSASLPDGCGSASLPVRRSPSKNSVLTKGFRTNVLFVTVCVKDREPIFNDPRLVKRLVLAWTAAQAWHVGHYVIMPDHVHFMCTPNGDGCDLHKWIAYWKSLFSRGQGREEIWQRGCWDTQVRTGSDYAEKIEYMKWNPVRKGLSERPDEWPHQGIVHEITWHD